MKANQVQRALRALADPAIAEHSSRFFKTGEGEYGAGDKFLGIRVPLIRAQVKQFRKISLEENLRLLRSSYHEERLCALLILVEKFKRGDDQERAAIFEQYVAGTASINNWDLVDSSAPYIVGPYLERRDRQLLYEWAGSADLWQRRIAMMATFHFIRQNDFDDALGLACLLRDDAEDLIHKAVGWMLREIGKRDGSAERAFLKEHYQQMPRTMLRYAIEKFPVEERQRYLRGTV